MASGASSVPTTASHFFRNTTNSAVFSLVCCLLFSITARTSALMPLSIFGSSVRAMPAYTICLANSRCACAGTRCTAFRSSSGTFNGDAFGANSSSTFIPSAMVDLPHCSRIARYFATMAINAAFCGPSRKIFARCNAEDNSASIKRSCSITYSCNFSLRSSYDSRLRASRTFSRSSLHPLA